MDRAARNRARRPAAAAAAAAALVAACSAGDEVQRLSQTRVGEPAEGAILIRRVGCVACHRIPGIDGPRGSVGPSLAGFARRSLIAGRLPNRPDELAMWVLNAPAFDPQTGMPPMPLTDEEAKDVAAYLYTLE